MNYPKVVSERLGQHHAYSRHHSHVLPSMQQAASDNLSESFTADKNRYSRFGTLHTNGIRGIRDGCPLPLILLVASLGYPRFAYLKSKRKKNPGEVLLSALSTKCLESRVAEALPWLLLKYPDLDWQSLVSAAKVRDLENKLGFVTCVARKVAEKLGENNKAELLRSRRKSWNGPDYSLKILSVTTH